MEEELKDKDLYGLFEKIEMPLVRVLASMEKTGVAVDTKYLKQLSDEFGKRLDSLSSQIYEIAGEQFNINSPKQLAAVMFEKLGLPVVKRTKTGYSTDVEVLEKLASKHVLPATILEFRELSKLKSTYVDALPKLIDPSTKRIHTSFNQTVTQTGRLSSSQPNLQNIPIKKEEGRKIRKAFVPGKGGWTILSCDYSQIELRILAHLSGDENLIQAFNKDLDIHAHTASLIFGVKEEDVAPEMRNIAKTVNFGIVYGMSPYGLSKDLGIKVEEASAFIDSYFLRYPKVSRFMDHQIEQAEKKKYVTTLFNRRRYIPEIDSQNNSVKGFAQRTAINAPIQGSAADLIKVAMIDIHKELVDRNLKTIMIIQVHDELVFEVPDKEMDQVKKLVKEKMEQAVELKVPVKVKVSSGKNWLDVK
jgi:DNA polymerase-1